MGHQHIDITAENETMISDRLREQELERKVKVEAWRRVLEKTNRIISSRPVTVEFASPETQNRDGVPAGIPAWTDGQAIKLSEAAMASGISRDVTIEDILNIKGLNYHELSHVLYSPREGSTMSKDIKAEARRTSSARGQMLHTALNILEDQRIETLFSKTYPISSRYFESVVLKWIVDGNASDEDKELTTGILIHGRKYLDPEIRVKAGIVFRKRFGDPLWANAKRIIDDYLTCNPSLHSVKATLLVKQFADVLETVWKELHPDQSENDNAETASSTVIAADHGAQVKVASAGNVSAKAQAEAIEDLLADMDQHAEDEAEAEKQAEAEAEEDAGTEAGDSGSAGTEAASDGEDGDGAADGDAAGGDDGDTDGDGGEAPGASGVSGDTTDDATGNGGGAGTAEGGEHDAKTAAKDAAQRALESLLNDPTVMSEVANTAKSIKAEIRNGKTAIAKSGVRANKMSQAAVSPDVLRVSSKIEKALRRVKLEADAEILRGQRQGRLNIQRVIGARPGDFDVCSAYDEGAEDLTGIEAVILMDFSGSMSSSMDAAVEATWALKRAFDKSGVKSTVIGFESSMHVLWDSADKALATRPAIRSAGGTSPEDALDTAEVIFQKSNMPSKVLVTVTDGQWNTKVVYGPNGSYQEGKSIESMDKQIASFGRSGVTTMIVGLCNAVGHFGQHGHNIGFDMSDVAQLPKAVGKLIESIMRKSAGI